MHRFRSLTLLALLGACFALFTLPKPATAGPASALTAACTVAPGDTCPSGPFPQLGARQDFGNAYYFGYAHEVGDLDGDGKPDMVAPNFSGMGVGVLSAFRNTGSPGTITFAARQDFPLNWGDTGIDIGDLDGDGKLDVAVGDGHNPFITLVRNTSTVGAISFAPKQDYATTAGYGGSNYVVIADLDGDGKRDISATRQGLSTTQISVFRNTSVVGSITVAARQDFSAGNETLEIAASDVDGDGKIDLVMTVAGGGLGVFRNTSTIGSITFAPMVLFPIAVYPYGLQAGDVDGDGKPDVVTAHQTGGKVQVLRNTSSVGVISFAAPVDFGMGASCFDVDLADLDCDGRLDIVAMNYSAATISVRRNLSSPGSITTSSFSAKTDFATGSTPCAVVARDIDGDGLPDVSVICQEAVQINVFRNTLQLACGQICGLKFADANRDGIRQITEVGLSGWTIRVTGPVSATLVTDIKGKFCLNGLPPGTYTLCEVTQPGWVVTTPATACTTLTLLPGQAVSLAFGNYGCGAPSCATPPRCTAGWWPFEECSGVFGKDLAGGNHSILLGGAAWGSGYVGCGLTCPPGDASAFAQKTSANSALDFGRKSFGIDAWIRTTAPDQPRRAVLDKRATAGNASPKGYLLFLESGRIGLQVGDTGGFTDYLSNPVSVIDGLWHLVAATVCRDSTDSTDVVKNIIRLWVDGAVVKTFTGLAVRHGSVTNSGPLRIGQQESWAPQAPFSGQIDEVEVYNCCVDSTDIVKIYGFGERGKCRETCYLPTAVSVGTLASVVHSNFTVRNYASAAQTYQWTLAGLPVGTGCSIAGPSSFTPAAGTVTVPPSSFVTVLYTAPLPAGLTVGQTTCVQLTIVNTTTGRCCTCQTTIRRTSPWTTSGGVIIGVPKISGSLLTTMTVTRDEDSPATESLRLRARSADDPNAPPPAISLNGLPPGQPWLTDVNFAGPESKDLQIDAKLLDPGTLELVELVLERHIPGTPTYEELGSVGIIQTESSTLAVPELVVPPARVELRITSRPTPFRDATTLHFTLPQPGRVTLEILDVTGRHVRSIAPGRLVAGPNVISWDARDESSRVVPSGVYLARLRSTWGDGSEAEAQTRLVRVR